MQRETASLCATMSVYLAHVLDCQRDARTLSSTSLRGEIKENGMRIGEEGNKLEIAKDRNRNRKQQQHTTGMMEMLLKRSKCTIM